MHRNFLCGPHALFAYFSTQLRVFAREVHALGVYFSAQVGLGELFFQTFQAGEMSPKKFQNGREKRH